MIGTIGGYIGLLLGYSALNAPILILRVIRRIREWFSERSSRSGHVVGGSSSVKVNESKIEITNLREYEDRDMISDIDLHLTKSGKEPIELRIEHTIKAILREKLHDMADYIDMSIDKKFEKIKEATRKQN